jgi:phosphohistidine swiveling domain-containing protein
VWASALCDDVLARSGHHQVAAEDAGLAVLVQPFVDPDFSGTAEVGADGTVKVVAVKGAPAPLMTGWHPGVTGRCGADGGAEGEQALALLGVPLLQAVAELARAVRARVGDNAIEWAALDGRPLLLQSRTVSRADHERAGGVAEHAGGDLPAHAEAVVLRVLEYAGPTGEDLVLPWLLAGPPAAARRAGRPAAGRAPSPSPRHAWRRAQAMCEMLTAGAWPRGGKAAAASALSELRAGRVRSALARFERLPSADPDLAGEAIALLRQVADGLAQVGAIDHPGSLWALPPGAVSRLLEHPAPTGVAAHRGGAARRWEGLAFSVLVSTGNEARGEAASGGIGAGQPLLVEGRPERVELPPRAVVVAPLPLPHLAPLLWGASALVTFGGGAAAHLIEVANSLSVPAVVGCAGAERLVREGDGRRLAAVDGNTGTVWFGRTT